MEPERWSGDGFVIERKGDRVVYADSELFCYSTDTDADVPDRKSLRKIFGRGKSHLASCSGNGCYVLKKISASEWLLHLHPSQRYLADLCIPRRDTWLIHSAADSSATWPTAGYPA